jgi:hypothetical protein
MQIALTSYTKATAKGMYKTKNYLAEYNKFSQIRQSLKQPPMQVFKSRFKQVEVSDTRVSGAMMKGKAVFINNQCKERAEVLILQW